MHPNLYDIRAICIRAVLRPALAQDLSKKISLINRTILNFHYILRGLFPTVFILFIVFTEKIIKNVLYGKL